VRGSGLGKESLSKPRNGSREVVPSAHDRSFERKVVMAERDIFLGVSGTTYVKVPASFSRCGLPPASSESLPILAIVRRCRDYSR
jgi:hypothetical protein